MLLQAMSVLVPVLQLVSVSLSVGRMGHRLLFKVLFWGFLYSLITCTTAQVVAIIISLILRPGDQVKPFMGRFKSVTATGELLGNTIVQFLR